jgi:fructose-bisphosphate aldolase class 1
MKYDVEAYDKYEAEEILRDKIIIDSIKLTDGIEPDITSQKDSYIDDLDPLKEMFGLNN